MQVTQTTKTNRALDVEKRRFGNDAGIPLLQSLQGRIEPSEPDSVVYAIRTPILHEFANTQQQLPPSGTRSPTAGK